MMFSQGIKPPLGWIIVRSNLKTT